MPTAELFPLVDCSNCGEIVSYEVGEHEGADAAQKIRCHTCDAVVMIFHSDGEWVECPACREVVPSLITHLYDEADRRQQINCPACSTTVVTFYSNPVSRT